MGDGARGIDIMIPYHGVQDWNKVRLLSESMNANGWMGAPLVVWDGEYLLTGVHRYAAAQSLGWSDSKIPTIEISAVFAEAGLSWVSLHTEYGSPTIEGSGLFESLLAELPQVIRSKYGIDII
jgi:hypothetical protein